MAGLGKQMLQRGTQIWIQFVEVLHVYSGSDGSLWTPNLRDVQGCVHDDGRYLVVPGSLTSQQTNCMGISKDEWALKTLVK